MRWVVVGLNELDHPLSIPVALPLHVALHVPPFPRSMDVPVALVIFVRPIVVVSSAVSAFHEVVAG
ncbi:MAG: hypothetical protein E2P02_28730 [Acidobacteria bacterium]|nr:MAG: hypothetical protein E2P02_28730 [Acidobacteriota bacterium]